MPAAAAAAGREGPGAAFFADSAFDCSLGGGLAPVVVALGPAAAALRRLLRRVLPSTSSGTPLMSVGCAADPSQFRPPTSFSPDPNTRIGAYWNTESTNPPATRATKPTTSATAETTPRMFHRS